MNEKSSVFKQAVARLKTAGLPVQINTKTQNALVDLNGKEGDYRLVLMAQPSPDEPRSLHLQNILVKPEINTLNIDRPTLLEWINAKNTDLVFGRYYLLDDLIIFELVLPVSHGDCDWAGFDEFTRLAVYSMEDAIAQLKAVANK